MCYSWDPKALYGAATLQEFIGNIRDSWLSSWILAVQININCLACAKCTYQPCFSAAMASAFVISGCVGISA